jgi:hypothetical protein
MLDKFIFTSGEENEALENYVDTFVDKKWVENK